MIPYTASGTPLCDPLNDINPADSDIACNSTDHASAYFGSDGTTLGFAFVLAVDPRTATQQGPLLSNAYVVGLHAGGTLVATVGVDGKLTGDQDYVYAKCAADPAFTYTELVTTAASAGRLSVTSEPGGEGYFRLTFQVPLAALSTCGVTGATAVQLAFGTSQAANLDVINKDELGLGDAITPGDPTTSPKIIVTKVDLPDPVLSGDEIVFLIGFENAGTSDATGVVLTDVVPAGTTFVSATGGGVYDPGSRTVTWTIGTLPVGGSGSVVLRVGVASNVPAHTVITNTAIATTTNAGSASATSLTDVTTRPILAIVKSAAPNPVAAGAQLVYTIQFANIGFTDAQNATITDPLPPHTAFVSAASGGTYDAATNTVTWSLGVLAAQATGSVTLRVQVDTPLADQTVIANTATLSASNATSVSATAAASVTSTPALELSKTAAPDPAKAGEVLTYTLTYRNAGSDTATVAVLTDAVPANTTFVMASNGGTFDPSTGIVTWTLGTLPAGAGGSVTLQVMVASPLTNGTLLTNTAGLVAGNAPFVSAQAVTTVTSAPQLSIVKTGPAGRVNAGQRITYTITVANGGTDAATAVALVDSLPGHTSYVSASDGGTYDAATNTVTWSLGTLAAGASRTRTVIVDIDVPLTNVTAIVNAATVTSASTPPQTAFYANEIAVARTLPSMTMDFRFAKSGKPDDMSIAAIEGRLGPGQVIDAPASAVTIDLANAQCGGTFSRIALPAGSLKVVGKAQVAVFTGKVIDAITGARETITVRLIPIGPLGYRVTLEYKNANFTCLEGKAHRSVRYTITIGDARVQTDVCFQRQTSGTLYWPPRTRITCP